MGLSLSTNRPEQPLKKHPINNHPLNFVIDTLQNDDDPWPIEWMTFNILNEYPQPDSKLSRNEAARCLDAILPENRPARGDEEKESVRNWMLELSDLIWKIAKQISFDHEAQDKLVRLLQTLRHLPVTHTIDNYRGEHMPAWVGFPDWHDGMRHALCYPEKRESPSQQTCDQYVNASAFAARVHAAAVQSPLECEAFAAIQAAVEGLIPDDQLLPCHILAGAQWIVLATAWLWSEIRWGKVDYHELRQDASKFLPLPPSRWARWLHGFQKVAAIGEGHDVRYWAGLAVAEMEGMMRSEGFTAEMMGPWDPEKRSLLADVWEDEKYAHLFKVPENAAIGLDLETTSSDSCSS